ncbi:hypothetical protein ABZ864_44155 [Streptomyces sp. NPDC047082]|uniref:hypothetical protein n=1 Tax=Streptomyces sp. NPDC047082 TaxID=3155259 RepID=UPI0033C8A769
MSKTTDLSAERQILPTELRRLEAVALRGRDRTDAIAEANRRLQQARLPRLSPTTVGGWFEKGTPARDFEILWGLVEVLVEWSGQPPADTFTGHDRAKATARWTSTKELWKTRWEQAKAPRSVAAPPGIPAVSHYVGRPIGEFDDRLVLDDLEVHPALAANKRLGALPAYVTREFDTRLGSVVAAAADGQSGIAILVGGSSTGKTRACWEAVKNLPDGWRLWHPIEPDQPTAVISNLDLVAPQTVVWLNEAQHYLLHQHHSAQVASGLRGLLSNLERGPVLVLGTIWPALGRPH